MSVAFDAKNGPNATGALHQNAVTSISTTCITIGSGTNRALGVLTIFSGNTLPASLSVKWDTTGGNTSLAQIGSSIANGSTDIAAAFGLVAPVSGPKQFGVSWSGTDPREICVFMVSFTGVDQTGGTTSFQGFTHTGTSNQANVAVTSNAADGMFGAFMDDNTQGSCAVSDNAIDAFVGGSNYDANANYATGTGTHTLTGTWGGSCTWGAIGVNVSAAGGGGDVLIGSQRLLMMRKALSGWRKSHGGVLTPAWSMKRAA